MFFFSHPPTTRLFLPSLLLYFYNFKSLVIRGSLLYAFLYTSSNYLHHTYNPRTFKFYNYYIYTALIRTLPLLLHFPPFHIYYVTHL